MLNVVLELEKSKMEKRGFEKQESLRNKNNLSEEGIRKSKLYRGIKVFPPNSFLLREKRKILETGILFFKITHLYQYYYVSINYKMLELLIYRLILVLYTFSY